MSDYDHARPASSPPGRVFLVTGASSGIGKAIAHALLDRGDAVVAMARSEAPLQALAAAAPERAMAFVGDVADEAACRAAVEATTQRFGRLDGVIHAAGISMRALAEQTQLAVFRRLMEVNYYSTVALAQAALPALRQSRGHLVVISSMVGKLATPYRSGYAASKHAVQGFMDALRLELTGAGVHVMTVLPGYVKTNVSLNALTATGEAHGKMDAATEAGLAPEAVADAVLAGMDRRVDEIAPGGALERFGLWLRRFAPGMLNRMLRRRFERDAEGMRRP